MEFKGKVTKKLTEKSGTKDGKNWTSSKIILEEVKDKYPAKLLVEFFNKKSETDKVKEGDSCTVHYNTDVTEWNGEYYGKNSGWKIETAQAVAPVQPAGNPFAEQGDDLPFN